MNALAYFKFLSDSFQMPEEDSFAVFVKIMQDYKMRDMFKPTMAELGLCMFQLENLVQVFLRFGTSSKNFSYDINFQIFTIL